MARRGEFAVDASAASAAQRGRTCRLGEVHVTASGIMRYEQVASAMAAISAKRTGGVRWAFIVLCTPEFAEMNPSAVDLAFDSLLASSGSRFDYAELLHAVRGYCQLLGLPEPGADNADAPSGAGAKPC